MPKTIVTAKYTRDQRVVVAELLALLHKVDAQSMAPIIRRAAQVATENIVMAADDEEMDAFVRLVDYFRVGDKPPQDGV